MTGKHPPGYDPRPSDSLRYWGGPIPNPTGPPDSTHGDRHPVPAAAYLPPARHVPTYAHRPCSSLGYRRGGDPGLVGPSAQGVYEQGPPSPGLTHMPYGYGLPLEGPPRPCRCLTAGLHRLAAAFGFCHGTPGAHGSPVPPGTAGHLGMERP